MAINQEEGKDAEVNDLTINQTEGNGILEQYRRGQDLRRRPPGLGSAEVAGDKGKLGITTSRAKGNDVEVHLDDNGGRDVEGNRDAERGRQGDTMHHARRGMRPPGTRPPGRSAAAREETPGTWNAGGGVDVAINRGDGNDVAKDDTSGGDLRKRPRNQERPLVQQQVST